MTNISFFSLLVSIDNRAYPLLSEAQEGVTNGCQCKVPKVLKGFYLVLCIRKLDIRPVSTSCILVEMRWGGIDYIFTIERLYSQDHQALLVKVNGTAATPKA